jgi:hypothetical protein
MESMSPARLNPLIRKRQPYTKKIAHHGIWAEPPMLADVGYGAKSAEGKSCAVRSSKAIRENL